MLEHLGPPIARKDLVEPIRISMDINETRFVFQFADKFGQPDRVL